MGHRWEASLEGWVPHSGSLGISGWSGCCTEVEGRGLEGLKSAILVWRLCGMMNFFSHFQLLQTCTSLSLRRASRTRSSAFPKRFSIFFEIALTWSRCAASHLVSSSSVMFSSVFSDIILSFWGLSAWSRCVLEKKAYWPWYHSARSASITQSTVQPVPTRHRWHACIQMQTALSGNTRTWLIVVSMLAQRR